MNRSRSAFWAISGIALLFAASLGAQSGAPADLNGATAPSTHFFPDLSASTSPNAASVVPAAPDNYRVGAGDLLYIHVFEMPDMDRQVRIDQNGAIRLPLLAHQIQLSGLTAVAAARRIARDLSAAGMARDPQVDVIVRQVSSRKVIIYGDVRQPGVIEAVSPLPLTEAISRAGGLSQHASGEVQITMPGADSLSARRFLYKLSSAANGAQPMPILRGGEVVDVLPAARVYSIGALQRPGAFTVRPGQPLTVLRLIALSQGLSRYADRSHMLILSPAATAAEAQAHAIHVNLNDVIKGKIPDFQLRNGQVLFVPQSWRRRGAGAALTDIGQALTLALAYGKL